MIVEVLLIACIWLYMHLFFGSDTEGLYRAIIQEYRRVKRILKWLAMNNTIALAAEGYARREQDKRRERDRKLIRDLHSTEPSPVWGGQR